MFILYYNNQPLHVTTHQVCYIYLVTKCNNVFTTAYQNLRFLIKSWPTQTEKFLSPSQPPFINVHHIINC